MNLMGRQGTNNALVDKEFYKLLSEKRPLTARLQH
jgi:hypothetical protein